MRSLAESMEQIDRKKVVERTQKQSNLKENEHTSISVAKCNRNKWDA